MSTTLQPADYQPGRLVGFTRRSEESTGRVVSVNGSTVYVAIVQIDDGQEQPTGEFALLHKGSLWYVPTNEELRLLSLDAKAQHLDKRRAETTPPKVVHEPGIKEIHFAPGLPVPDNEDDG